MKQLDSSLVNILKNSQIYFFLKDLYFSVTRRAKFVTWNHWISKYLNSNFITSNAYCMNILKTYYILEKYLVTILLWNQMWHEKNGLHNIWNTTLVNITEDTQTYYFWNSTWDMLWSYPDMQTKASILSLFWNWYWSEKKNDYIFYCILYICYELRVLICNSC